MGIKPEFLHPPVKDAKVDEFGYVHCEDGPAFIRPDTGTREWFIHGIRHRENGPAIEAKSSLHWFYNGKRHRINGPAIVWTDTNVAFWYKNDIDITREVKYFCKQLSIDHLNLTEDDLTMICLWVHNLYS